MGASSGAIRAGKAFVEISGDDSKLMAALNRSRAQFKAFGSVMREFGASMAAVGAAVVAPLVASTKMFTDEGSRLTDMSARTGVAVEALSALSYAAELSGTSMEDLEGGIRKMQKTLADAASGSGEAINALAALGLTVEQLASLSPDKQFELIADRLAGVADPGQRAAEAMAIFGKNGTALLPMMADGAAGLESMRKEAEALGLIMSAEDAAAADKFGDTLGTLGRVLKSVAYAIGSDLMPVLQPLATQMISGAAFVAQWVREHAAIIATALKVGAAVAVMGASILAAAQTATFLASTISAVVQIMAILPKVTALVTAAMTAATGPVGLLVAAISLLIAGIATLVGISAFQDVSKQIDELKAKARDLAKQAKASGGVGIQLGADDSGVTAAKNATLQAISQLHQARIAAMQDEEAREIAGIERRYAEEMTKFKNDQEMKRRLTEAMEQELANTRDKYARQHEATMRQLATERIRDDQARETAQTVAKFDERMAAAQPKKDVAALQADKDREISAETSYYETSRERSKGNPEYLAFLDEAHQKHLKEIDDRYEHEMEAAMIAADRVKAIQDEKELALMNIQDRYTRQHKETMEALEIERIESAEERELASIDATYKRRIEAAEEAGMATQQIEEEHAAARRNIEERYAKQREDNNRRLSEQLQDTIIDLSLLKPIEKTIAHLEAERKRIFEQEADPARQQGLDLDKVNQFFDAKELRAMLDQSQSLTSARGTFSGSDVYQLGATSQVDRLTKVNEQQLAVSKQMLEEIRNKVLLTEQ